MKGFNNYLLTLIVELVIFEYIYKTNYLYYYYNKKLSKIYEVKLEKTFVEKYKNEFEEKLEKAKKSLRYHQCVKNRIPKISGLLETAQYLRYSNSSIVRFGDGEIELMEKRDMYFQKVTDELSRRLIEAFKCTFPSYIVALPNIVSRYYPMADYQYKFWDEHNIYEEWILKNANYSRQYFDTLITSPFTCTYGTSCELVDLVYKELREIWKDKDVVILRGDNGEKYKYDVYDTAKSQKVYYGKAKEAWGEYEEYKRLLMNEDKDSLFIISIGPTSKVLVYDLVKEGRKALDMGHLAKDYNCYKKRKYDELFY